MAYIYFFFQKLEKINYATKLSSISNISCKILIQGIFYLDLLIKEEKLLLVDIVQYTRNNWSNSIAARKAF